MSRQRRDKASPDEIHIAFQELIAYPPFYEKVDGIDRRLEKVEGTQKNQVWTLIILLGGAIGTAAWRSFFSGNP